uniref:Uncharacterized protein n=1 Tax=Branchiostoma floridae TaxID=7739 RepID=C3YHX2_BRAFL|eukprot:XP_002604098.1 hypothetical protein BRAFLDRAFT_71613 [Branchiostoma floridae]
MPSTSNRDKKPRSKEDTWKADELQQSLKEAKRERRSKDGERDNREKKSSRNHDKDDDRRRKHRSEEPRDDDERHRKHRSKEHRSRDREDDDRHRKHRSKDEEDRPRKHRSKEEREDEERPRKHRSKDDREDEDRPRKHRSKEERGDEDERHRKHRSKEHREDREDRKHRSKEHREEDENRTKKHRSGEHRDKDRDRDRDRRDRDEDKERRRRERKERERDGSRDGSKQGSEDSRDRRKEHRSKEHREKKREHRDKEHHRGGREDGEDGEERRHKDRRSKEEGESRPREDRHQGRRREEVSVPEAEVPEEPENEQPAENNTEGNDYDDDEFEDYDDDFEDEDEDEEEEATGPSVRSSEVRAIMEAMNQENATISPAPFVSLEDGKDSSGAYSDSSTSNSRPTTGKGRTFINFVAAKQRQVSKKVATKTTKRGKELMRLLELDFIGHDILDIPPLTEYELYIRSFGSSNTQQAYTQCGDDNIDREVQTEEVEITQKWTQHPSSQVNACGDESSISGTDQDQETKAVDTVKLTNFLNRSCQVVAVLLEEELSSRTAEPKRSTHSNMAFSDNMVTLVTSQQLLAGK